MAKWAAGRGYTGRPRPEGDRRGQAAAARYDNETAIDDLGRSLALLPADDHAARYAALLAREDVYHLRRCAPLMHWRSGITDVRSRRHCAAERRRLRKPYT